MNEIDPLENGIDSLLRRSMTAPIPTLPLNFDRRVLRTVRQDARPLDRYRQIFLAGYGMTAAGVSAVVMRGQGLGWATIAATILGPLALVAATSGVRRAALANPQAAAK